MIVYILIYVGLYVCRFFSAGPAAKRIVAMLLFLLLFAFSAFRFEVGCDWLGYVNQYNVQLASTVDDATLRSDPFWWLMIEMLIRLDLPYKWLNVVSSAIFFLGAYRLAIRQPDPLTLLIFIFPVLILLLAMSAIRQGTAMGVICLAINAFNDKRPLRYLALVLVATGIHTSAGLFMLLTPLVGGKYTPARVAVSTVIGVVIGYYILRTASAESALTTYVNSSSVAGGANFRVGYITFWGIVFLIFVRKNWKKFSPSDFRIVDLGAWVALALLLLLPFSSIIADRLSFYLIPIQAIMFTRLPLLGFRGNSRVLIVIPHIVTAVMYFGWISFGTHTFCYAPYQTWLFGEPQATRFFTSN